MNTIHLDDLPVGAAILSRTGDILYLNHSFNEMLLPSGQHIDGSALELLCPEDREWVRDQFAELVLGMTSRVECCVRLYTGAGRQIWVLLSAQLHTRQEGARRSLLVIAQDLSLEMEMLDEFEGERRQPTARVRAS